MTKNDYSENVKNILERKKNPVGTVSLIVFLVGIVFCGLWVLSDFTQLYTWWAIIPGIIATSLSFISGIVGLILAKKNNLKFGSSIPGAILGAIPGLIYLVIVIIFGGYL